CRDRHCPCCGADRGHRFSPFPPRQRGSQARPVAVDRFHTRRTARIASEHARADALVAPHSLHLAVNNRGENALACLLNRIAKDLMNSSYSDILVRIERALEEARGVFDRFTPGEVQAEFKAGLDPVTEADRAVDAVLRQNLLRDGEGWLSEESADDLSRLDRENVWVVDPLDGTREFVMGLPEFCVSIGYVENGKPGAGG